MQEIVQGKRHYNVTFDFDEKLINDISNDSGSQAVLNSGTNLRFFHYWNKQSFFVITVDNCAFAGGVFGKKHFRLAEFAVRQDKQGKGYGKFIMEYIKALCMKKGKIKITLRTSKNEKAYKFYEKKRWSNSWRKRK